MGLQRFPIGDFTGGLNLRDGPWELQPDEAQFAVNFTLSQRGVLQRRKGISKWDTNIDTLGGVPNVNNLKPWFPNNGIKILMASIQAGGNLNGWSFTPAGVGTARLPVVGLAGDYRWTFESMEDVAGNDRMWCINGVSTPQKITNALAVSNWTATVGAVPNGKISKVWKQRMIISGVPGFPQHIYWSNPNDPEGWPANNFLIVSSNQDDLDPVTEIATIGDVLLIFKRRSVWAIHDPVTFDIRKIGSPGCSNVGASAVIGGKCYFNHDTGIYSTQGITADLESDLIQPLFENVFHSNNVVMLATPDRRLLVNGLTFVGEGSGYTDPAGNGYAYGMLELIPDLRARERPQGRPRITSGPWMFHYAVRGLEGYGLANFVDTGDNALVLCGTTNQALMGISRLFVGTTDIAYDGTVVNAAEASWWPGWRGIQEVEQLERIRKINLYVEGGPISIDVFKDIDDLSGAPSFTADSGGPYTTPKFVRFRPETRGRYHVVKIRNKTATNGPLSIHRAELSIRGGKEH